MRPCVASQLCVRWFYKRKGTLPSGLMDMRKFFGSFKIFNDFYQQYSVIILPGSGGCLRKFLKRFGQLLPFVVAHTLYIQGVINQLLPGQYVVFTIVFEFTVISYVVVMVNRIRECEWNFKLQCFPRIKIMNINPLREVRIN